MKIEMYTKTVCPYCIRAKNILKLKGFSEIIEYNLETNPELRKELLERTLGAKTVPQIFIQGKLIGGCQELMDLDAKGELDTLLGR
jgi:glutaredoxin 3